MSFTSFSLDNGLRVVHIPVPGAQTAVVNVLYNVGGRDDRHPHTGIAHLLEHMMFGGSVNIAKFDREIELAGGKNNAWTSDDFTCYWDEVPAANIETALWLESDRMMGLAFNEHNFRTQKSVVIEEFKQTCLNRPLGMTAHHLRRLVFKEHPYRTPVIGGELSDIESVSLDYVKDFYLNHYAPNNAVLCIAGPFEEEQVRELARKWFGGINRRDTTPRKPITEPEQTEPRREEMRADIPNVVLNMAFPMPGYDTKGYFAADMLTDILSSGKSARFHRNLIENTDSFISADAGISGLEEPGYLLVKAVLRKNTQQAIAEAEKLIWNELDRAVSAAPTELEIQRAKNRMESVHTFGEMSMHAMAQNATMAVMHNEKPDEALTAYRNLTAEDVQNAATEIFTPKRANTLICIK